MTDSKYAQCKLQIKTCMSKQWACKQYRNKAEEYTKTGIYLMPTDSVQQSKQMQRGYTLNSRQLSSAAFTSGASPKLESRIAPLC